MKKAENAKLATIPNGGHCIVLNAVLLGQFENKDFARKRYLDIVGGTFALVPENGQYADYVKICTAVETLVAAFLHSGIPCVQGDTLRVNVETSQGNKLALNFMVKGRYFEYNNEKGFMLMSVFVDDYYNVF